MQERLSITQPTLIKSLNKLNNVYFVETQVEKSGIIFVYPSNISHSNLLIRHYLTSHLRTGEHDGERFLFSLVPTT